MALVKTDFVGWKRFNEGRRREIIGPFRSEHDTVGPDCFVSFFEGKRQQYGEGKPAL